MVDIPLGTDHIIQSPGLKVFSSKQPYQEVDMSDLNACKTCGKVAEDPGHLCAPVTLTKAYVCQDCGESSLDARHVCKPKLEKLKYTCDSCGRLAVSQDKLCKPKEI